MTSSAEPPALGAGINGKLSVWTHKGLHQLVLGGHPLYRFAEDSGNTAKGQGLKSFGGTWELVTARGAGYTGTAASSGSSATSSSATSSSAASSPSASSTSSASTSPASSWS